MARHITITVSGSAKCGKSRVIYAMQTFLGTMRVLGVIPETEIEWIEATDRKTPDGEDPHFARVIAYLGLAGSEGATRGALAGGTDLPEGAVTEILRCLMGEGLVVKDGAGKKGDRYRFRLKGKE